MDTEAPQLPDNPNDLHGLFDRLFETQSRQAEIISRIVRTHDSILDGQTTVLDRFEEVLEIQEQYSQKHAESMRLAEELSHGFTLLTERLVAQSEKIQHLESFVVEILEVFGDDLKELKRRIPKPPTTPPGLPGDPRA